MTPAVLAVLASRVRAEEKQIFAALERRGVPYEHVDPRGLAVEIGDAGRLAYTVALNREISHSRARYAALLLEACDVRVINSAEVIEVCGDKLRTSLKLAAAGLPVPRTVVALTPETGAGAAADLGFPVVIKPVVGSWGRLAAVARDRETAVTVLEHRAALPSPQQHIAYIQKFVGGDSGGDTSRDIRVIVVGDEVLGATYRYGRGDWRTNVARGAESRPCPLTPELSRLALAASGAVGGGVLGVDLIEGPDGPMILEINHAVEFRAFQAAHGTGIDVAGAIAGYAAAALR